MTLFNLHHLLKGPVYKDSRIGEWASACEFGGKGLSSVRNSAVLLISLIPQISAQNSLPHGSPKLDMIPLLFAFLTPCMSSSVHLSQFEMIFLYHYLVKTGLYLQTRSFVKIRTSSVLLFMEPPPKLQSKDSAWNEESTAWTAWAI